MTRVYTYSSFCVACGAGKYQPQPGSRLCEACAAGKPTYVFGAEECTRRFGAFHDALRESRRARPWVGALEPPELWEAAGAPSDVERAADRARTLLSEAARAAEPGAK